MKTRALLVRGHQGVGKTVLSEQLAEHHGFCRLSKDELYLPVMERYKDHRLASDIAYMGLVSVLRSNARSGINFVVDAPFNGPISATSVLDELNSLGLLAKSVLLICSDQGEWENRLMLRGSTPNHLVTSLAEIKAFRGSLDSPALESELVLDTSLNTVSISSLAEKCVEYLFGD